MRANITSEKIAEIKDFPIPELNGLDHPTILANFINLSTEGMIIYEPVYEQLGCRIIDFKFIYANRKAEGMMGRALANHSVLELFPGAGDEGILQIYINIFVANEPTEVRDHHIFDETVDGWFKARACRSKDFLMVVFSNISSQYALEASEERYRFMADSIPHVLWTATSKGMMDFYSRRWAEITGLNEVECMGDGWLLPVHPEDRDLSIETWNQAVASQTAFNITHRFLTGTGEYLWMQTHGIPFYNEHGVVIKWFGITTNIHRDLLALTGLKYAKNEMEEKNQKLERINDDLDAFVFLSSHDLTAPVANLEGLTSLLSEELEGKIGDSEQLYLKHIRESTSRLKQTIYDLTRMIQLRRYSLDK